MRASASIPAELTSVGSSSTKGEDVGGGVVERMEYYFHD